MVQPRMTLDEQEAMIIRTHHGIPPWRLVSEYLVNSADSNNLAVDGTGGSPQTFSYTPPSDYDLTVSRIMIFMQASSAMSVDVFANLVTALAVGIEIKAAGVLLTTWKDNIDLYTEFFDVDTLANVSNATADTTLNGRWTFERDTGGFGIEIANGELFEAIINDDLSSITQIRMHVKGHLDQAV